MKLKGLTKLALSGVALAAVAATLGTSTYAWYVSNSQATVAGVNGATADSVSGNLLVSQVKLDSTTKKVTEDGAWGNKLSSVTVKQTPTLNPVSKDTDTIKPDDDVTGWHDKANKSVAVTTAYGYYAFGVWSTDKVAADMEIGIANTTSTFKYQKAYTTEGLNASTTGIGINDSFTTDFLQAMRVEIFQAQLNPAASALTLDEICADDNSLGVYCPADSFLLSDYSDEYALTTPSGAKAVTGGNAHTYYTTVLGGETPAGGTTEASTDTLSGTQELDLAKVNNESQKYVLVFRYWLEGTDTDCFDCCGGQTFEISLRFTAK